MPDDASCEWWGEHVFGNILERLAPSSLEKAQGIEESFALEVLTCVTTIHIPKKHLLKKKKRQVAPILRGCAWAYRKLRLGLPASCRLALNSPSGS